MNKIIALACLLVLSACEQPQQTSNPKAVTENITYALDSRTELCFAFLSSTSYFNYHVISFTNVPREVCRQFGETR